MVIRKATLLDSPGLARVQVDSYRTAYADFFPQSYMDRFSYEEQTQDWRELLSTPNHELLFVAQDPQGAIVGYALGKPASDPGAGHDGELLAIHVRRSLQRQGIGRRLLAAVVQALQEQGCRSLWLTVLTGNPVRAWYDRLGGTPFGQVRYTVDEMEVLEFKYGWPDIDLLLGYANGSLTHPLSNSQVRSALEADRLVDISTTGRKTGRTHRLEIWFHYLDGHVYLTGRPARRDWYANMRAQPRTMLYLKESVQLDLEAWATPIMDVPERRRVLSRLLKDIGYEDDLEAWIAGSPLVHIALRSIIQQHV